MKHTVMGVVADPIGTVFNGERAWSTRASEVRCEQPSRIPVDVEHDRRAVGRVVHLERRDGSVIAVAEVDADPFVNVAVGDEVIPVETDWYWSAERHSTPSGEDVVFRALSLTRNPARVNAQPLTWYEGGLGERINCGSGSEAPRRACSPAPQKRATPGGASNRWSSTTSAVPRAAPTRSEMASGSPTTMSL